MFSSAKIVLVLILAGACSLVLVACSHSQSNSNEATPIVSLPPDTTYPMPPVKAENSNMGWTLTSNQHVRLSDYRDKVVVLDFYATWCEPCRDSIPHLIDLQKRFGSQGLQVIGLNAGGQDDYDKVPDFAREFQIDYPLGIPDPELEHLYIHEERIPQTLVIDRNGRLLRHFIGYGSDVAEELDATIKVALASTEPAIISQ